MPSQEAVTSQELLSDFYGSKEGGKPRKGVREGINNTHQNVTQERIRGSNDPFCCQSNGKTCFPNFMWGHASELEKSITRGLDVHHE